jgi:uncharacterized oxidoreductase
LEFVIMPRFRSETLREFAVDLFLAAKVDRDEAATVAQSLVESNLRGHDSHGVIRVAEYIEQLGTGQLIAGGTLRILAETSAVIAGDGGRGFGQVLCRRLIEIVGAKAREQGVACGTLMNCGHVGRLGEWVERAARDGLAGLISVNDNGVAFTVAPPGGIAPRISTNPIAIGVPTDAEPLVLDISTSAVANGKLKVARLAGREVPPGWIQDAAGNASNDPNVMLTDPPGMLLPFGGDQSYKAFGLGLLFDILVAGLSGGFCPPAPSGILECNNVLLVLWDPAWFAGHDHFRGEADKLINAVRDTPRKPGVDRIQLPGDRSADVKRDRLVNGIPLDGDNWETLARLAKQLDVRPPQPL